MFYLIYLSPKVLKDIVIVIFNLKLYHIILYFKNVKLESVISFLNPLTQKNE